MLAENSSNGSVPPASDDFVELIIANQASEVDRAGKWLAQQAEPLDLSDRLLFGLELVLEEALTNIISYAYQDSAPHDISIRIWRSETQIWLQIEDDGIVFNPLVDTTPPVQAKNLHEAEIGHLGVHLIRGYMDDCHYQRDNDRNLLSLGIASD